MSRTRRMLAALLFLTLAAPAAHTATAHAVPADTAPAYAVAARPAVPDGTAPHAAARVPAWTGSWETGVSGTTALPPGAAVRNAVHLTVGGTAVRVRLSNRLGTEPLRLDEVTVARQRPGRPGSPAAVPGSLRAVTFRGERTAVLPSGADAVSDPVRLTVAAGADLLVTVRPHPGSGPATYHRDALRTGFVAPYGTGTGTAAEEAGTAYTAVTGSWYYVTGVDVRTTHAAGTVVALGDSLTDGIGTTPDTDHRWPDLLAARLRDLPPQRRLGVLNAGISGNRLLRDGTGPSALSRLTADALTRTGVRVLVVFEGINDIKGSPAATDAEAFVRAYRTLVTRAHRRGVRVVGVTLTPFGGHRAYTPAREAVRQSVNTLIRGGEIFDAVLDFDAVVRDPDRPWRIRPDYDCGDHLHLGDAGTRALADAVDLAELTVPYGPSGPDAPVWFTPRSPRPATPPRSAGS
ncbi:SGNH/GDSL hydrolase family protein [Streptomyces sp. NPDC047000]|uniref:SGNH/GDSL hydrolase family protein n=1 Tax=Streptomyces sp. NPDC047000 TaxID=3155474 RepID=UPI0033C0EC9E